jgi:hypothetical protein
VRLPRARKIVIARPVINILLSTGHENAAGILRLCPSPVEPTPVSESIIVSGEKVDSKGRSHDV